MDRLFEIRGTEVFAHVVCRALDELGIELETVHLDRESTSFSLAGDYQTQSSSSDEEKAITITHGYFLGIVART